MKRLISFLLAVVMLLGMMPTVMAASPFSDVPADAYYYDAVLWAVENNITTGTGNGKFSPLMNCTRSQVVTFLWRAAGSPEPTATEMNFTDVPADAYYYDAVLWAVEKNITTGTGNGKFSPLMDCSRAQIVTFLWRSQGSPAVSGVENPFKDVPAGQYYTDAVLWAVKEGITTGTAADKFSPDMICTRSQIVTFLYRCMGSDTPDSIVITQQPVDPVGVTGDTVSVSVKAEGGKGVLSYLWQYSYDGTTFYNAPLGTYFKNYDTDTMSFTIEPTDFVLYDGWYYRCVITDEGGSKVTSDTVQLRQQPLTIITQVKDAYVDELKTTTYSIAVSGGKAPYTYQWQQVQGSSTVDITQKYGDNIEKYSGWNTNTLTVKTTSYDYAYSRAYRCIVTDANGDQITSEAGGVYNTLRFVTQPKDAEVIVDQKATFTVMAAGGRRDYKYTWQCYTNAGWSDLTADMIFAPEGLGTAEIKLLIPQEGLFGMQVRCVVTDANGETAISDTATVYKAFTASLSEYGLSFNQEDDGVWVKVIVEPGSLAGEGPYTYQWYTWDSEFPTWYEGPKTDDDDEYYAYWHYDGITVQAYCKVRDKDGNVAKTGTLTIYSHE